MLPPVETVRLSAAGRRALGDDRVSSIPVLVPWITPDTAAGWRWAGEGRRETTRGGRRE